MNRDLIKDLLTAEEYDMWLEEDPSGCSMIVERLCSTIDALKKREKIFRDAVVWVRKTNAEDYEYVAIAKKALADAGEVV